MIFYSLVLGPNPISDTVGVGFTFFFIIILLALVFRNISLDIAYGLRIYQLGSYNVWENLWNHFHLQYRVFGISKNVYWDFNVYWEFFSVG